jgi:hypothetical protein
MVALGDELDLCFAVGDWPVLAPRTNDFGLLEKCSLVPGNANLLDFAMGVEMDDVGLVLSVYACEHGAAD